MSNSWPTLLALLAAPLARERALESPTRQAILREVTARPGISMRELAHRIGADWSSLHYHVQRMIDAKVIDTILVGRHRLVYLAPLPRSKDPEERAALLEPTARRIAMAIAERPGTSAPELVLELGESARVVYHNVKRLADLRLVEVVPGAGRRGMVAAPRLLGLLAETQEP